jgi:phenylacetate-CoA ligase
LKPSELENRQLKQFKALLKYAYENVAFYHRKFRDAGVKPDAIKSFKDLRKVPTTSKFEVQACNSKDLVGFNVDLNSLIRRTTSGSTGVPLVIFTDGRVEDFYNAVWMRAMLECGLRVRDRMAVIADPRTFPKGKTFLQRLRVAERKYISIFDSAERQMALLKEFRPDVVKGYSSSLIILAVEFGEALKEVGARMVFSGAELLNEADRRLISSTFGAELFDFYACSELGWLAWECKAHSGYHVNADSVLLEFLDEKGESVAPGEKGRVIGTSLFNNVMPLIRYELEDVAVPVNGDCPCGITLPLIRSVEGRADDFLITADGRKISPTVFFPYPFESVEWIKQFRIIQESRKKLIVQVVPKKAVEDRDQIVEKAEHKLCELFGEVEVEFEFMENVPLDSSGKIRKVVSRINRQRRNS